MKSLLKGSALAILLAGSLFSITANAEWDSRYHDGRWNRDYQRHGGYQRTWWQTRCVNGVCYKVKVYKRCYRGHCWIEYDRKDYRRPW